MTIKSVLFDKITTYLRTNLSEERYMHTLGTTHACIQLAYRWNGDVAKAAVAGLLHDMAKTNTFKKIEKLKDTEMFKKETGIGVRGCEIDIPKIWHAAAAGALANKLFGITDADILHAVKIHPTGGKELPLLSEILIIADYIEPQRSFPGVNRFRKLAFEDKHQAITEIIKEKIEHVKFNGGNVHPASLEALDYYCRKEVSDNCSQIV